MNLYSFQRPMDRKLKHKTKAILEQFFTQYEKAIAPQKNDGVLRLFKELVQEQFDHPYTFELYHKKIRHPIDYYKFGLSFIRPLVDLEHSTIHGMDVLDRIGEQVRKGENVI